MNTHPYSRFRAFLRDTSKTGWSLGLAPALLICAAPLRTAGAQVTILGDLPTATQHGACSMLLGSPAIEGSDFVVELLGARGGTAIVALSGPEAGLALRRAAGQGAQPSHVERTRVQLDAEGRGRLTLLAGSTAHELVIDALIIDASGQQSTSTQALIVRPLPSQAAHARHASPPPSAPPPSSWAPGGPHTNLRPISVDSTTVFPPVADVGSPVAFSGPQFATLAGYAPKDVHAINSAITGCVFRVDALTSTSMTATVESGSPFPFAAPIRILGGSGLLTNVPNFGGMSYPIPVWSWRSTPGAPSFDTTTSFKTTALSVFQPCDEPAMFVDLRFRLEGGIIKVELPGAKACKGDKFRILVGFALDDGTRVAVDVETPVGLAAAGGWFFDSLFPLFPLSFALAPSGSTAAFNSATNEIWISPPSTKTITAFDASSTMRIDFDPAEHVIVTETHGVDDDYSTSNGPELTTPSAAWDGWVLANYGVPTRREYDDAGCNRWLRDTFSGYGPGVNGAVRSGNIQLHINGYGCETTTDHVVIGYSGGPAPVHDWAPRMSMLETLNYGWNPGDDATLCFDLAQLPIISPGNVVTDIKSVIERVAEDHLDVGVDEDTTVDSITVKVVRCKNP